MVGKFFKILGILLFLYWHSDGQTIIGVTKAKEEMDWAKDTMWFVNDGYNAEYAPKFNLELEFPEYTGTSGFVRIDWGDESPVYTSAMNALSTQTHLFEKAGLFKMTVELFADGTMSGTPQVLYRYVMNRELTAEFKLVPSPFKRCLEWEGDSVLLVMTEHDNPPETVYDIVLDSRAIGVINGVDTLGKTAWTSAAKDSAWIVFSEPSGIYGCDILIRMTYKDEAEAIDLETETNPQRVNIFKAPDIKKIFNFADTLEQDQTEVANFKICTSDEQNILQLDPSVLGIYQYKTTSSTSQPYYHTYRDRSNFEILYYYTDTPDDPDTWQDVTGNPLYADTTEHIGFHKAGFYKLRITASNNCNSDPQTLKFVADTLYTERVKDQAEERYFQVSESSENNMVCMNDTLCQNLENQIILIDRNERQYYDDVPEYEVALAGYEENRDFSTKVVVYKADHVLTGNIETLGCDSTYIIITLIKKITGKRTIWLARNSVCGSIDKSFEVHFGDVPEVPLDTLYNTLLNSYEFYRTEAIYHKCDSFRYDLQWDIWTDNSFLLDSNFVYFSKGSVTDTAEYTLKFRDQFDFDSTGNRPNYIRIKAHNYCGWSREEAADFYTRTKPSISLLRDSVPVNDSLCLDFSYHYYLGGVVPENYQIMARFSKTTLVNDTEFGAEAVKEIPDWQDHPPLIKHSHTGEVEERFIIANTDMPACSQVYDTVVNIINPPDTLVFKDNLKYCDGLPKLDTKKLFGVSSQFERAEWKWNDEEINRELFPEFTFSGLPAEDVLRYKISESKGCYREGKLQIIPKAAPELQLLDEYQMCLPDTIKNFKTAAYVVKPASWSPDFKYAVYRETIDEFHQELMNKMFIPWTGLNGKPLIYVAENSSVDTAFRKGCYLADSVILRISTPKLVINQTDRLSFPWATYDFAHLEAEHIIDTMALVPASIKWTHMASGNEVTGSGLYARSYSLQENEKNKDSLLFELSANSYCGRILKDTLVVLLNHVKVNAYKDTICSNTENYPLWNKIVAANVDETSVEWKICYPDGATGLAGNGITATYSPAEGADSVRIYVEVKLEGVPSVTAGDTVVFKINPAPQLNLLTDTLMACGRKIDLDHIDPSKIDSVHCRGLLPGEYIAGTNGGWSGRYYQFTGNLQNYAENITRTVTIKAKGLPGCGEVADKVVLVDPVYALPTFKRETEEMCAGDDLKLDTIYTMEGKDRFTHFKWALETTDLGRFNADTTYYEAFEPEDHVQGIRLQTSKSYTCYTGAPSGEILQTTNDRLAVIVHREPVFAVNHRFDTLCFNQEEITIKRDWVVVGTSLYPDYQDSLRLNGQSFVGDLPYPIAFAGLKDTLVLTVAQGMCTKWQERSDTIFLYRLPPMITGDFMLGDICEGTQALVNTDALSIHPTAIQREWSAVGGSFIQNGSLVFVPDLGVENATVTLQVTPPKAGCFPEMISHTVEVDRNPELLTTTYVVCRKAGTVASLNSGVEPGGVVQKVEWFRADDPAEQVLATIESPFSDWNYIITEQDSLQGEVWLKARITAGGACMGNVVLNDIHIALQNMPAIFVPTDLTVCQGAEIDLNSKITGTDLGASYQLELKSTSVGTLQNGIYAPGEYWGNPQFIVQASGIHGCPQVEKEFQVEVKYAPIPQMHISDIHCQNDTVHLSTSAGIGVHPDFSWNFGDNVGHKEGKEVWYLYDQPGAYIVRLDATYGSCNRFIENNLVIHPKPQAAFDMDPQIPIGVPVHLNSSSIPADVNCRWSFEDGSSYTGKSCSHIFTGETGERKVILWVKTDQQCKDSVSNRTMAVTLPQAKFKVEVDSCRGVVKIQNQSIRNEADVAWDFGNNTSLSDVWDPADLLYSVVYQDTVYQISLTLTNVAGSDTYSLPVKMISKLATKVEVFESSESCNKLEKEIHIQTKGKADTTKVWWGDGKEEKWSSEQDIKLRKHRYSNDTTMVLYYPVVVAVGNTCHQDTTSLVAVPVLPVSVKARVILDTNYRNECFGVDRGFENKSFGFDTEGYNCEWLFEREADIVTNNEAKVSWLFEKPGVYMVKLRVRDNCNEDQDSVRIVVHGNDSLDFEIGSGPWCTSVEIPFKYLPKGKEPFGDFRWEFPGNIKREGSQVAYSFTEIGKQWVKLTAKADGCKTSVQHAVNLFRKPEAVVSPGIEELTGCSPLAVNFKGRNGNDEPCVALWDFKDQTFSDQKDIVKEFKNTGEYPVTFTLTTPMGCKDSVTLPVKVLVTPEVAMELQEHLFCTSKGNFGVTALNLSPDAGNCAFEWFKNEEQVSIDKDSAHFLFTEFIGKAGLKLRAVHKQTHCAAEVIDSIVSAHAVKAILEVSPAEVCDGEAFTFINRSDFGDYMTLDLGDGTLAEDTEFEYIYDQSGKYQVGLKVGNREGCKDSLNVEVRVNSLPTAAFNWEKDNSVFELAGAGKLPDKENGGIRFENGSYFTPWAGESDDLAYSWDFGDTTAFSTDRDPVHVYPNNGSYDVWLRVKTVQGCKDSISDVVTISTIKGLFLPNAFAPATADEGMNRFQPKGVGLYQFKIKVCNLKGTCVWTSDQLKDGRPAEYWDGNFNGQPAPKGVYNWEINAVFLDGSTWNHVNGSVVLIR